MISNELLGEMLGIDCKSNKIVDNMVVYNEHYRINVYEFMHFCKEWLVAQGYDVLSGSMEDGKYRCYLKSQLIIDEIFNIHYGDTEIKAVTTTCQWIYDKELS